MSTLNDALKTFIEAAGYKDEDVTGIRVYQRRGSVQFITKDGVKGRALSETVEQAAPAKKAPAKKTAAKKTAKKT